MVFAAALNACTSPADTSQRAGQSILHGSTDANDRVANATVSLWRSPSIPMCTGTLITSTLVLTAAHCVFDSRAELRATQVRVGLNSSDPVGSEPAPFFAATITGCLRHPQAYRTSTVSGDTSECFTGGVSPTTGLTPLAHINASHDLAVLVISPPVPRASARPRPVRFTSSAVPFLARISGFGVGTFPRFRNTGTATVGADVWTPFGATSPDDDVYALSQVGAESPIGTNGDSGGPLLVPTDQTGDAALLVETVGVFSYSRDEALDDGVYTDLTAPTNRNWLQAVFANPAAAHDTVPSDPFAATGWSGEGADAVDNCPGVFNPSQDDADGDGRGDVCDLCPRTGVPSGDIPMPRFRTTNQVNANTRVESQLGVRAAADLCDTYPTNPIDEINNPIARRSGCVFGLGIGDCVIGSSRLYFGMAPRVAEAEPSVPPPPMPPVPFERPTEIVNAASAGVSLVSPTWRCVCADNDGAPLPVEFCYGELGPCRAVYAPPPGSNGRGWFLVPLQRTVSSPTLTAAQVFGESTGSAARPLPYRGRTSRADAAREWRLAVGEAAWFWDWAADPNLPDNLPETADYAPEVVPAEAVFWTRAQYPNDPGRGVDSANPTAPTTEPQRALRMADVYTRVGVPLVNAHHTAVANSPFLLPAVPFNTPPLMPVRPPGPPPSPIPAEHHVGRYLTLLYPLTGQSAYTNQFFSNGGTSDAVRGLVVGQLDVRQATLMSSAATQGAAGDLPVYVDAAYATAQSDPSGWGDVAAFGGRDASGTLTGNLYFTTHGYGSNGDVLYTWHKATTVGSPPSPRTGAALSYNATSKRLYVLAGRDDTQALDDLRYYDIATQKWYAVTLSGTVSARYHAGLAVYHDTLFVAGGAAWGGAALGDLYEISGTTGDVRAYGNVLPLGAKPWLAFDDHDHGLVYGGGYIGTTWYSDVWLVDLQETTATASFVYNFAVDGMAATVDYAVVADLYHGMYWGVPGYNPSGSPQALRYLRDATSYVVDSSGNGSAPLAARSASPTGARPRTTNPPRQLRRRDSTARSERITARTTGGVATTAAPR